MLKNKQSVNARRIHGRECLNLESVLLETIRGLYSIIFIQNLLLLLFMNYNDLTMTLDAKFGR